jgi:hypothetical protein
MNGEASAFGHDFSKWARLTERYAEEVEALRRREPGASMRLMQIGLALKQHQDPFGVGLLGSQFAAPPPRRVATGAGKARRPLWRTWMRAASLRLRRRLRARNAAARAANDAAARVAGNATARVAGNATARAAGVPPPLA